MYRETTALVLGRGEVYFDRFETGAVVGAGERYLGNTPSFQITRTVERLERATSYGGKIHASRGAVISESIEIGVAVEHMAKENVDLWFSGESAAVSSGDPVLPFEEEIVVQKGLFYQLGTALVIGGHRFIDNAVLVIGATTLIAGQDYVLERDHGRIQVLPTAPRVDDGDTIEVTYYKRVSSTALLESTPQEVYGALRYIARDPYGPKQDYWFPQVRISPRGAVEMKEDNWRRLGFDVSAVKLSPVHALVYSLRDLAAPVPITADTTLLTADTTLYSADNGAWEYEG